jgi:hypothetical protein
MSAVEIESLTEPPTIQKARDESLQWLNSHFPSFEHLEIGDDLDKLVEEAQARSQQLDFQVIPSNYRVA